MALAVSRLGVTFNTNSGTKTVTATPVANDLIVIVTAHSGNTSAATPTDDNSSGAYTTILTSVKTVSGDTMMLHIRTALVGSGVSTIFSHAPGTSSGGGLAVYKVTGMTRTGASAARQSGKLENQTVSAIASASFGGAALTGNAILGVVFSAGGSITATTSPAYTQDSLNVYISPAAQLGVQHVDSGETNTTITWGSGTATQPYCVAILELDASSTTALPSVTDSTAVTDTPTISLISNVNVTDSSTVTDTPNIPNATFMEPGGDADFQATGNPNNFWGVGLGTPTIVTDFVHGGHQKSIKYAPSLNQVVITPANVVSDSGGRMSFYVYFNALPTATAGFFSLMNTGNNLVVGLVLTTSGVLQLWQGTAGTTYTAQIGGNGSTLSSGTWYRISIAFTVTSTSVNRFEIFKNGSSDISVTNATITNTTTSRFRIGNIQTDTGLDFRSSDHYTDNSNNLIDTGDVWVTAKRPFSNGTTNGFTTQVGSGSSGYGSGHAPQVNERPLSTTNGWSMVGAGSAVTEEYTIEDKSVGDIDISGRSKRVIGYTGWFSAKSLAGETGQIIVNGVSSPVSLTSTNTVFTKIPYSTLYPVGGADIGITTDTSLTTVTLNEAGVIVAYVSELNVIDSTTVSDTPTLILGALPLSINVSDSTVVTDLPYYTDDTIIVWEKVTLTFPVGNLSISVTDSTAVTDTPTIELFSFVNVSDSTAVADTPTVELISLINVNDSTAIGESITLSITSNINVTDSSAVGELVTLRLFSNVNVIDSTAVTDTPTLSVQSFVSVTDSTAVGEAVTLSLTSNISVTDSSAVGEAVTVRLFSNISVTDSTAIGEVVTIEEFDQGINVTDSIAVGELVTMSGTEYVNATDVSTVSDTVTMSGTEYLSVTDSSAVGEATTLLLISAGAINVQDSTAVGEAVTVTVSAPQVMVTDSSVVTDSPVLSLTSFINMIDSTTMGESVTITEASTTTQGFSFVVFID